MSGRLEKSFSAVALAVGMNMRVDAVSIEAIKSLKDAGIRAILLKGPTVVRWLYGGEVPPVYADTDLLVSAGDFGRAEHVLRRLGFETPWERLPRDMPGTTAWVRNSDGASLDLHMTLIGVEADPDEFWRVITEASERMMILGAEVEVLSPAARALHIALHASQHSGEGETKAFRDLERALDVVPFDIWVAAADLAERVDALAAFGHGLRLSAKGAALSQRLNLPLTLSTSLALKAIAAPASATRLVWLTQQPGIRWKVLLAARKIVPPPAYLRVWWPFAARGPLALAIAYVWRPVWVTATFLSACVALIRVRKRRSRLPRPPGRSPDERRHDV
jgi:hypothetical protein